MAPKPTAAEGTEEDSITFTIEIQATLKRSLPVPRLNLGTLEDSAQAVTETEVEDDGVAALPPPVYEVPAFRFKFLDGTCKETPVVPTTDDAVDGWEEVEVPRDESPAGG